MLVKESVGADLLVLGTQGLDGFTGLVVGSTAVEVAARAYCPVAVIHSGDPGGAWAPRP